MAATKKTFALAAAKHNPRVKFTDSQMNEWMREAMANASVSSFAAKRLNAIPVSQEPRAVILETGNEYKRREAVESARQKELMISPSAQMGKVGQGLLPDAIRQDMNVAREGLLAGLDMSELSKKIADMRGLKEDRLYVFDLVRSVQSQLRSELEVALRMQSGMDR